MPIELLLEGPDDGPGRLVSIVSRDAFDVAWRPIADRLGLGWVTMMRTGFTVRSDDVPAILEELRRLDRALRDVPPALAGARSIGGRGEPVARLMAALRALSKSPGASAYLG